MPGRSFKDLLVWQKAMDLCVAVYQMTESFPREERFGLTSQLRRASVSVPSNVAEGQCRGPGSDFLRFLRLARGSLGEMETQLQLAGRLGYLSGEDESRLLDNAAEVGRLLNGLLKALQAKGVATFHDGS